MAGGGIAVRELFTKLGFRTDEQAVRRYDAQFAGLKNTISAVKGAIVALGVERTFRAFLDNAEELIKVKAYTGAAVEELQLLKFMAGQSETSFEELSNAMRFFTMKTGIKPTVALFGKLAAQLQKLPEQRRLGALKDLFGPRGAPSVLQLLKEGPEGLRRLTDQFNRFGTTLSQKNVEDIDHFGDRLSALGFQLRGIRNQVLLGLLPAFERMGNFIEENPTKAFTRFLTVLLGGLLVMGRWRLAFGLLVAGALQDIQKWRQGQDSIMRDVFGPWVEFVEKVGPTLAILHDLLYGNAEGGAAGRFHQQSVTRTRQWMEGDWQGWLNSLNTTDPSTPPADSVIGRLNAGAYPLTRMFGAGAPTSPGWRAPMINAPVSITVPPGTPQDQVQAIEQAVRRSILGAAQELNESFPEVEHGH